MSTNPLNYNPYNLIHAVFFRSREWTCPICDTTNLNLLPDPPAQDRLGSSSSDGESHSVSTQPDTYAHTHIPSHQSMHNAPPSSQITQPDAQICDIASQSQVIPSPEATDGKAPGSQTLMFGDAVSTTQTIDMDSPSPTPRSSTVHTASTPSPTPRVQNVVRSHRSSQKPPLLLDSAICILVVVVFTIICRRVV